MSVHKTRRIEIRVTQHELDLWQKEAQLLNLNLSEWLRLKANTTKKTPKLPCRQCRTRGLKSCQCT